MFSSGGASGLAELLRQPVGLSSLLERENKHVYPVHPVDSLWASGWRRQPPTTSRWTSLFLREAHCEAAPEEGKLSRSSSSSSSSSSTDAVWDLNPGVLVLPSGGKLYQIELKPLLSAFLPGALARTTLRCFALAFVKETSTYLQSLQEQENEDADEAAGPARAPEPVDLSIPTQRAINAILIELATMTVKRFLERVVVHHADPRIAWKLMKDTLKSAERKATRKMGAAALAYKSGLTAFRVNLLGVMAASIVKFGMDFYDMYQEIQGKVYVAINESGNITEEERQKIVREAFQTFLDKQAKAAVRAAGSLVGAAVGAGLGTVLRPGTGTWLGGAGGDFLGVTLASSFLESQSSAAA